MIYLDKRGTTTRYAGARKALAALVAVSLALLALTAGLTPPANAQQAPEPKVDVGATDPDNGFPFWYQDKGVTNEAGDTVRAPLRLEGCLGLTDPNCLPPPDNVDVNQPVSFPGNFPEEFFYSSASASVPTEGGGTVDVGMDQEAAFGSADGLAAEGQQLAFQRIRIRASGLVPGDTYRITYPYGVDTFTADTAARSINSTVDTGCPPGAVLKKCDFNLARSGPIGPYLTWDTFGTTAPDAPPAGYIGDPNVTHTVTGSPNGTNYVLVERQQADGTFVEVGRNDQFTVAGKIATPQVSASVKGDVYNKIQDVSLIASDPTLKVYYTTDGTDPTNSDPATTTRVLYDPATPIQIGEADAQKEVTLKFYAEDASGKQSPVKTEVFTIDTLAPNVSASPDPAAPYDVPQDVTLSTNEPANIYYTADGSTPTKNSTLFDPATPIKVERSQTIKAIAFDIDPQTGAEIGNQSRVETFDYTIATMRKMGPIDPSTGLDPTSGFPFWYEDQSGTRLDLCTDPNDPLCVAPPANVDPTQPISFPNNFPEEAFYWSGDATIPMNGGGQALLIMSQEAAFGSADGLPAEGQQLAFQRIRIRIDAPQAGTYKVTYPYGTKTFNVTAPGRRSINVTEDLGCAPGARCDFNDARFGKIGPFLKWDSGAPEGYVGDPATPHTVTGSPLVDDQGNPQNYFKVEGPGLGANGIQTNEFTVAGKLSRLQVGASKASGFYNAAQNVTLTASADPADPAATIYYTLDGSEPTTASSVYGGPISIANMNAVTTLKYMAVDAAGNQSDADPSTPGNQSYTRTYTLDNVAPTVAATPPGGTFENNNPSVALNVTNNEPGPVKVYYTTDGSDPSVATNRARVLFDAQNPIAIGKDTALKFAAVDAAGNQGAVVTENYTIIDTIAPAAPAALKLAAASDTGDSPTDGITNATTLTFTGTAEPGSTVNIFDGATQVGSATAANDGAFSVTTSALQPGERSITATATDPSGNEGAAATLSITIDTTNPTVAASPKGGTYPRAQSVTLTPSETAKVYYTRNGGAPNPGAVGTLQATGAVNIAANTTLRFIAVDTAGNRSVVVTEAYRIQNARPTITNFGPTGVITDRTPRIAATVNDTDSNLTEANITLTLDGRNVPRAAFVYNATNNRLTYQVPAAQRLAPGRHNVTITVRDIDGGTATRTWSFRIQ